MARENKREPIFHIVKRMNISESLKITLRLLAILIGMVIGAIFVISISSKSHNFFGFFGSMASGVFSTQRKFWKYLLDASLLLGVSIALVPAFKMKFWNLGGNGQILMGCLGTCAVMYYLGDKLPDPVLWILMLVASTGLAGIWALIPAIFKAFFKTNESLFTLMLNYIASILIEFFISYWYQQNQTGSMDPLVHGNLPTLGNSPFGQCILPICLFTFVTVAVALYLHFSKHGYELEVVGESENTARYVGVNVKVVTIRTVVMSGALCGLVGFVLSGAINGMMSTNMDANMGFTGIMVAWLSHLNPVVMVFMSLFISFVTKGMAQVNEDFGFTDETLSAVIKGIIFFILIASEFSISYKIVWREDIQRIIDKLNYPFVWVAKKVEPVFVKIGDSFNKLKWKSRKEGR